MLQLILLILAGAPIAVSDIKYRLIPNRLLVVLWIFVELLQINHGWRFGLFDHLLAISFLFGGSCLSLLTRFSIGMGDIKLFALLALLLGGLAVSIEALTYASIIALFCALVTRDRSIPFGPPLILGSIMVILGG